MLVASALCHHWPPLDHLQVQAIDPEAVWVIMDDLQHGTVHSVMLDAGKAWAPFCPKDHLLPDPTQALRILEAALQETASRQQAYMRNVPAVQEAVRPS